VRIYACFLREFWVLNLSLMHLGLISVCCKEGRVREGVGAGGRNDPSLVCTYE
jgi:hypothetical protein